ADGPLQSFYLLATCGNDDLVKLWHISGGLNCSIRLSHKLIGHDANWWRQNGDCLGSKNR
ncbi:hypothetical protein BLA29_012103, partial [Euroglyphus maynei]